MPFPFYGQDGYLRSTVVNVFDKFCLKLVSRQFIQIKILFLIQLFLLLIGSQLMVRNLSYTVLSVSSPIPISYFIYS